MSLAAIALGAFAWTFAEYALHNWYGHLGRGKNDFSREHLAHHRTTTYFSPLRKKAATAAIGLAAITPVAVVIAGASRGLSFAGGFLAMYVLYELVHRRIHTTAPWNPYMRWARRHHLYHHFGSAKKNHGVTTPLWDLVFGTYASPGVVRIPPRQAPGTPWLFDADGNVAPRYARDYELARRGA